jgi:hypothetical protein
LVLSLMLGIGGYTHFANITLINGHVGLVLCTNLTPKNSEALAAHYCDSLKP